MGTLPPNIWAQLGCFPPPPLLYPTTLLTLVRRSEWEQGGGSLVEAYSSGLSPHAASGHSWNGPCPAPLLTPEGRGNIWVGGCILLGGPPPTNIWLLLEVGGSSSRPWHTWVHLEEAPFPPPHSWIGSPSLCMGEMTTPAHLDASGLLCVPPPTSGMAHSPGLGVEGSPRCPPLFLTAGCTSASNLAGGCLCLGFPPLTAKSSPSSPPPPARLK